MKKHCSYLALCVAASLPASQAYAETETNSNPASTELIQTQEAKQLDNGDTSTVEDISSFYSNMDMRMRLAVKADAQVCNIEICADNKAFDAKVQLIGESLAKSAYLLYPDLQKTTPKFEFELIDKKALGSASNANGKVILFRPIQHLDLDDNAIAFIIGREMGHVIAKHHKSNAKTKLLFTALTTILFPAAGIISASSAAAQATTATTLMTSAASTLTSYVGSEVALSRIKPGQLSEADSISLALLEYGGITALDTAQSLEFIVKNERGAGWEKDLNLSIENVRALAGEPQEMLAELDPLPDAYVEGDILLADEDLIAADTENAEAINFQMPALNQAVTVALQEVQPQQNLQEEKLVSQDLTEQQLATTQPVKHAKTILITNETIEKDRKTTKKLSEKPLKNSVLKRDTRFDKKLKKNEQSKKAYKKSHAKTEQTKSFQH